MQYGKGGSNWGLVLVLFVPLLLLNSSVVRLPPHLSPPFGTKEELSKQPETLYAAQLVDGGQRLSAWSLYNQSSVHCNVA